jgi:serine/threonine-protein phosphatase CPPED1
MNALSQQRYIRKVARAAIILLAALVAAGCGRPASKPFTFVQLCDPQLGMVDYTRDLDGLQRAVAKINRLAPDFVLICGDMVNVPDDKSFNDFRQTVSGLTMPYHCVPGNHDVGNTVTPDSVARYRQWFGADFYSFDYGAFTFVMTDAQRWASPLRAEQESWLKNALAAAHAKGRRTFVVSHIPLYVTKIDEPDDYYSLPSPLRVELLELFCESGVVAVLTAHTHSIRINEYRGIPMVGGGSTCSTAEKAPLGFRVWRVAADGTIHYEYVALTGDEQ